jgi:hypothetical protein
MLGSRLVYAAWKRGAKSKIGPFGSSMNSFRSYVAYVAQTRFFRFFLIDFFSRRKTGKTQHCYMHYMG